jgi:hypothetical protein
VQLASIVKKAVLMEIHLALRVITVQWALLRKFLALLAICAIVLEIRQLH